MQQIKGSLYYLLANSRFSLIVFWSVIIGLLLFTLIFDLLIAESVFTFHLSFPVYVFATIMGYWIVKNTIPYIIKLGGTRTNIFIAVGMYAIILTLLNAILANTLNSIVTFIFGDEKLNGILSVTANGDSRTYNHIGDFLGESTWFIRVIIDTSLSFFLLASMFIVALIFYRFSLIGGFSFLALMMATFIFGLTNGWLIDFFIHIFSDFNFVFFYQLFITGFILYLISYILLRRITL